MERPRWRIVQAYREAYGGLPRAAWLLALLELVNRSGMMVLFFFTLYMTRKLGFTVVQAGSVMSAYGVGSMVGTYLGGRLCDRLGAYHVQKLSLGVSAVLLVVLQLPRSPWLLAVLMLALAAFSDALHPASAAATAQICTPELRPKGFALHRLAGNLGVSIGPVVGGYLALLDYKWLFWVDGLTSLRGLRAGLDLPAQRRSARQAHAEAAAPAAPGVAQRAIPAPVAARLRHRARVRAVLLDLPALPAPALRHAGEQRRPADRRQHAADRRGRDGC